MNVLNRSKAVSLCLVGALLLPSGFVYAQQPGAAATYYQQASEAYQSGDYARADELLARAYAEDADLIYQYNRILANEAMGDFDRALEILGTFQEQMKLDPQARFSDIDQIQARLKQARAEANAAQAIPEPPAPAETPSAQTPSAPPVEPVQPADSGPNILGWTLVGVGAAGLGAAALFGSTVLVSDIDERFSCTDANGSDCYAGFDDPEQQFADDKDTWQTHKTLTWVSLGVGVAALVGGGVALYLGAQSDAKRSPVADLEAPEIELTPYFSADAAGGSVHISF